MEPQYEMPVHDENAPDLYIPWMSLITYVLLCALCYGQAGKFNPEVIPDVCTKCFLTQLLEVVAIRIGFYMMQTNIALLDLVSYTGYKYLGLCINLLVGLLGSSLNVGGTTAYYVCFLWTASAASYLMLKIMSHTVPRETAAEGPKRKCVRVALSIPTRDSLCSSLSWKYTIIQLTNRRDYDFVLCWLSNGDNVVCGPNQVSLKSGVGLCVPRNSSQNQTINRVETLERRRESENT